MVLILMFKKILQTSNKRNALRTVGGGDINDDIELIG